MKISELQARLDTLKRLHGDQDIELLDEDYMHEEGDVRGKSIEFLLETSVGSERVLICCEAVATAYKGS